jgi:hypothetical protein
VVSEEYRGVNMENELKELDDESLVRRFEHADKLRKQHQNDFDKVKEELLLRIAGNENNIVVGALTSYSINEVHGLRVKGLKDIENELGREWLEENRDKIVNETISVRLKKHIN